MTIKERLGLKSDPVFLMDGTAYIYRGFYASRNLRRSDGFPTNALVIVTRVLLRVLREENPLFFLFAMDGRGRNFRNDIYEQYKANRESMPEELAVQIGPVGRMVDALGLAREVNHGIEADDCIASLAARFSSERPVIIISGDKDLKQCLGPQVFMWDPGAKEEKLLTAAAFLEEAGVSPAQWPDVQAITGDSSDNIPGVAGIGPKTARQIFKICPTLEDIRDHFALLPPKIQEKLKPSLADMFKWRQLTTLRRDACPHLTLDAISVRPINIEECASLATEFELSAVRREIGALQEKRIGCLASEPGPVNEARKTAPAIPEAREISSAAVLPECSGRTVAVIWTNGYNGAPRVAIGDPALTGKEKCGEEKEFLWRGEMADLCRWLGAAARIVVADWKSRLTSSPSWRSLYADRPGPNYMDLGLASYLLAPEDGDYGWERMEGRWREPLNCENSGAAPLALAMAGAMEKNLAANELSHLYDTLEMPLVPVLAHMEERGIAIDPAAFQAFLRDVRNDADKLEEYVYESAGVRFNIKSARQLGEVLFEKMKLGSARKTRTGQASTSQQSLEKLAGEPVVDAILRFRKLDKMRSTYLDPLPRLMDANGRIHTTFNQEATATGRLSSSNPNLQNIPVRGELGKRMRACFIAAPGNRLVAADYSQIELRILAHLSGDQTLLEAFRENVDIHARTAALIFDLHDEKVSADQRRMAKTINFGLLYGMGAQKLAQELKITAIQAKEFIERYFSRLAQLKNFYEDIIDGAREKGFVSTMAGRRRWLPGIFSANGQTAAQAQRQAVNTVIQGSAADVIKMAMIAVEGDEILDAAKARLVLQVHDELLLEVPEASAGEALRRVVQLMENVKPCGQTFDIPLKVDGGTGANWGEAH